MAFLIVLLASLFASAWLLSTQTLHRIVAAAGSEGEFILFLLLSVPTFLVVLVASCGYFLGRRSAGTRRAALPLLINLASLLLLFFFPFGPIVDAIDFRVHETSRTEIVRLIETDQLPIYGEVIPLPRPYPDSISSLGGGRLLMAWREDGATHVFFSPAGTWPSGRSGFLYRSDGREPTLPSWRLPNATRSERLSDRWLRIVFR